LKTKRNSQPRARRGRVLVIGGGTGLSTLLRGLKEFTARPGEERLALVSDLAAMVTVTDDGGSSGRLRREYSVLPPGDIRNCMVALADDEALLSRLFQYRFWSGKGLRGHSFGNLFLTALSHITGDFGDAVRLSGQLLAIRGRIFPATTQNVSLEAVTKSGKVIASETNISRTTERIRRLRLVPDRPKPLPETLKAITEASLIVLGPGSLYTSVIPNLLVAGVSEAIAKSRATCVYIMNLMTQPGETTGLTAVDHVEAIHKHTKRRVVDCVIVNRRQPRPEVAARYLAEGSEPVHVDARALKQMGLQCIFDDLLEEHGVIRHDSGRLATLLAEHFLAKKPLRA
jgi:uncharacterized cofD-like protein